MKRSTRPLMLWSTLALAGGFLVVDWFTGAGQPATANAQQTEIQPAEVDSSADWREADQLVEQLTRTDYSPVRGELNSLGRELFSPTPNTLAMLQASPASEALPEPSPAAPEESTTSDFALRHSVRGVLLGTRPMAVVDGSPLVVGATLDGYRMVEINRDNVVFADMRTNERVTLVVEQVPRTPVPGD